MTDPTPTAPTLADQFGAPDATPTLSDRFATPEPVVEPEPIVEPEPTVGEPKTLGEPEGDPDDDLDSDVDGRLKAAKEAKKFRQRLADATTVNEALTAERDALRAELVKELVRGKLANPDDLGRYVEPSALLGEDGRLSRAKVETAVGDLLKERPYLDSRRPAVPNRKPEMPAGNSGRRGQATTPTTTSGSLADQLGAGETEGRWSAVLNRHSDEGARARGRQEA